MDERMRFVIRLKDGETMASLCREFGISRKTGYKICGRGRHCDPTCPRVLACSMIAAKNRLFSAEPKASKFPRYAHTEELAALGISVRATAR